MFLLQPVNIVSVLTGLVKRFDGLLLDLAVRKARSLLVLLHVLADLGLQFLNIPGFRQTLLHFLRNRPKDLRFSLDLEILGFVHAFHGQALKRRHIVEFFQLDLVEQLVSHYKFVSALDFAY